MGLSATTNNAEMVFDYGENPPGTPVLGNLGTTHAAALNLPFTIASTSRVTIPAFNSRVIPNPNPAKLAITSLNATTGQFKGTASVVDLDALNKPITRAITFSGLIVPDVNSLPTKDGVGVGWFLLQDLPTVPVTPAVQTAGFVNLQPISP
jgi:hypothetical protein